MHYLYVHVFPKVKLHILKNSGTPEQAKDIFQDAFVACWKNIKSDKFSKDGNVEGYLYSIAKNKWIDYLRSANYKKENNNAEVVHLEIVPDETTIDEKEEEQNRNAMHKALQQLGEACKTVLKLFYFERKSMNAIALELNITAASARNQKYRCMEKLRNKALELKNNG